MDLITLAMAKNYSDSKGGYTEKKVYTFNGNTTGRETFELYGMQFVVLDGQYVDPETIEYVSASVGGNVVEVNKSMLTIESATLGGITRHTVFTAYRGDDVPIILIEKDEASGQEGFSVIADPTANAYVTRIEFAETIVPIDPKYLPGVCLPVVELSFEQFDEIISAGESGDVRYTEGKVFEEFEEAFSIGLPCVIRVPIPDIGVIASILSTSLEIIGNEEYLLYKGNVAGFAFMAVRTVVGDSVAWFLNVQGGA